MALGVLLPACAQLCALGPLCAHETPALVGASLCPWYPLPLWYPSVAMVPPAPVVLLSAHGTPASMPLSDVVVPSPSCSVPWAHSPLPCTLRPGTQCPLPGCTPRLLASAGDTQSFLRLLLDFFLESQVGGSRVGTRVGTAGGSWYPVTCPVPLPAPRACSLPGGQPLGLRRCQAERLGGHQQPPATGGTPRG